MVLPFSAICQNSEQDGRAGHEVLMSMAGGSYDLLVRESRNCCHFLAKHG